MKRVIEVAMLLISLLLSEIISAQAITTKNETVTPELVLANAKESKLEKGRRTYEPIVFRKRIDKSSPLIARSLCNNIEKGNALINKVSAMKKLTTVEAMKFDTEMKDTYANLKAVVEKTRNSNISYTSCLDNCYSSNIATGSSWKQFACVMVCLLDLIVPE